MATVWMRSKLAKMKPKVEPRFGVKTLAEHGPGPFRAVRVEPPKDRTPITLNPAMIRACDPVVVAPKVPRLAHFERRGACVVYDLSVGSTLIKARHNRRAG
jgi:hypothetical protein